MVRLVLVFIALTNILFGNAQKSQVFLKGGLNVSKFSSVNNNNFAEVNSIAGFNVGLLTNLRLGKKIAIQPALLVSGKGAKTKGGSPPFDNHYFEATTRPYYLELPLKVVFDVPLKGGNVLFFGAGFYGALGIGGKNKIEGKTASGGSFDDEKKIDFSGDGSSSIDYHNWAGIGNMIKEDYGITATGGIYFKKFLIALDYEYGLKDISPAGRPVDDENKNRILSLSFGYRIF